MLDVDGEKNPFRQDLAEVKKQEEKKNTGRIGRPPAK